MGATLIVIAGPTAVGKTKLAIEVARKQKTVILSADARQFYRELIVGTARPTADELSAVQHYFIGNLSIFDEYSAALYAQDALVLLNELFARHSCVVICGGSGLYIKALLEGFDEMPATPADIRESVERDYRHKGLAWLQGEVVRRDPEFYATVDQKNPRRLARALEVYRATGMIMSQFLKGEKQPRPFTSVKIGLELPRERLYARIENRVDQMMASGLLEEARSVYDHRDRPALQTVGYAEMFGYLEGRYSLEEAVRQLKQNTRRYAKRQLTWFRKDKEYTWFRPDEIGAVLGYVRSRKA